MRGHNPFVVSIVAGLGLILLPQLRSGESPGPEKIDNLIKQLGSDTFAEREQASKELATVGMPALEGLRRAAKSEDAEVRKRAEALLPRIEMQAESVRLLAPKRIHLVYKDTPLGEALADFQKQSGYSVRLLDPDGTLKDRKITLDTGDNSFWHAFALLCDKADLAEASWEDQMRNPVRMQAPPLPGGPPGAQPGGIRPVGMFMPGKPGRSSQLVLKDGKTKPLPADDRSAARIRVVPKSDPPGNGPENEMTLLLDVSLEPKLQWQSLQSVHIGKAVDDGDHKLSQVIAQVEGANGNAIGNPARALPPGGVGAMRGQQLQLMARQRMGWGGLTQQIQVQLKKGDKNTQSLKELEGFLAAQVLAEPQHLITTDDLAKAIGKSFKSQEGGSIKILKVNSDKKETTIQLELEDPPYEKVVPAQPNVMAGVAAPRRAQRPAAQLPLAPVQPALPAAPPPAAPAMQRPALVGQAVGRPMGGPGQLLDCFNGLSVLGDKGKTLPIDASQVRMEMFFAHQANGAQKRSMICTIVCLHDEDKEKPAKVVYLGRKRVTIEIPFALKDVPLP